MSEVAVGAIISVVVSIAGGLGVLFFKSYFKKADDNLDLRFKAADMVSATRHENLQTKVESVNRGVSIVQSTMGQISKQVASLQTSVALLAQKQESLEKDLKKRDSDEHGKVRVK